MESFKVLVVDDEVTQRETLAQILRDQKYQVVTASGFSQATALLHELSFDMILTDFRMPQGSGLDVAHLARDICPQTMTLIMTAYSDVSSVIEALRAGVVDYLLKPLNVEALLNKIQLLQEHQELERDVGFLRSKVNIPPEPSRLLGESSDMKHVRTLISQVAQTKGTILITGESGTGKEVAARQIHTESAQKNKNFVAINCGAIPETLLESELFGHKKGAFTGAVQDKMGLFMAASGGTLFLDEIGDLPRNLQVKILRALQEREITPVGSNQTSKIDVRLIAATNRDLRDDVSSGLFRQDLFYRINVVEIKMPALRDRIQDLPLLARHILQRFSKEFGKQVQGFSNNALKALMHYRWPGNVRELENVIERAVILKTDSSAIELTDLPAGFQHADDDEPLSLDAALCQYARTHIVKVLEACGGDKKDAAKHLGLGLSSLYRKLEELNIPSKKMPPMADK